MTPERLAEIERIVTSDEYPCAYCPDLLTALREAQRKSEQDTRDFLIAGCRADAFEAEHLPGPVKEGNRRRKRSHDALQRRVEALEKALSDMLNVYESMAKDVETLYDDWTERAKEADAALRGEEAR